MANYSRPKEGFRFIFGGVNTRSVADALPPTKYATALNIRTNSGDSVRARPGYVSQFTSTDGFLITDIRAYTVLETDDLPRFLARDTSNNIILDDGATKATLNGPTGSGVSMMPFRPGASPQPWMYIAGQGDYKKFSAPDAGNTVTAANVGIAEPQQECDAAPRGPDFEDFTGVAADWTAAGTAGAPADGSRSSDTAVAAIVDPVWSSRFSIQVGTTVQYQAGEVVHVAAFRGVVQDVIPPIDPITIQAIRYYSGTSGKCEIVTTQLPIGEIPPAPNTLGFLRRGALVRINAVETVLVLNATPGEGGTVAFETVTAGTFAAGQAITGVPVIVVDVQAASGGDAVTADQITSAITTGTGTLTKALSTNPFSAPTAAGKLFQEDDYVHMSLNVNDPTQIVQILISFSVNAAADFTKDRYVFTVLQADLATSPGETGTGNLQWSEIMFPISSLVRFGNDQTRTLSQCNAVQVSVQCAGNVTFKISSLTLIGGSQPDAGADGAGYNYRAVPRAAGTGVIGNSSPPMRFAVRPRRQGVLVLVPSAAYDTQIDTWDIFRYGGSVTSYRYIGSAPSGGTFFDDFSDDAARAGSLLETDNFEPWPSLDIPFMVDGGAATIAVEGFNIVVSGFAGAWPASINHWIPGTLIEIVSNAAAHSFSVYTLRFRPVQLAADTYLFIIEENAGFMAAADGFVVKEPIVGRQILPYVWGPNEFGDCFGVGDPLRPGTISFTKHNTPDSAPDRFNLELTPPSEPLLGGDVIRGVSLVASTERWWALYPAFNSPDQYKPIQQSVGKGMVSGYGKWCDGQKIYFWAKDCIAVTDGGPAQSLTDADLYTLFPHEGVQGTNIIKNDIVYYAPDYSRAASFRLSGAGGYLYADYKDFSGIYRHMVCDLKSGAWTRDEYHDIIAFHYGVEQQEGTLVNSGGLYPVLLLGGNSGKVFRQQDFHNDGTGAGTGIRGVIATMEYDGGDLRAQPDWGDEYLDLRAPNGCSAQPTSLGKNLGVPTVIPASDDRQFAPISLGGTTKQKFVGLRIEWLDDFENQACPLILYLWQTSFVPKPEITKDRFGDWDGSMFQVA